MSMPCVRQVVPPGALSWLLRMCPLAPPTIAILIEQGESLLELGDLLVAQVLGHSVVLGGEIGGARRKDLHVTARVWAG